MVNIFRKLPQAGAKRRSAPAMADAIALSDAEPKKSGDRTETPQGDRRDSLSECTSRGVQRSWLAAAAPVPSAGESGDAIGTYPN